MNNNDVFKKYTFYQIYPKSFLATGGQSTGTLQGVISKLSYLKDLGVDIIWLTPTYPSPQNDNGYDVADYCNIEPSYGTMSDMEELINKAAKLGMGIMLDMVFNHTSTSHEWFKKALAGDKTYQDYYILQDGVNDEPPTNWVSKFGGNAWQYEEKFGKYYLHLFDKTQADLNLANPMVRKELANVLNFWLAKGVKGFRFDVINLISKPISYENDYEGDGRRFYTDGAKVLEYMQELRSASYGLQSDIITVGELSSTSIEKASSYSDSTKNALSMSFHFHHLKVDYENKQKWSLIPFNFEELTNLLHDWQIGMQENNGWSALFWSNHDQPRALTRFGDDINYHYESATMLASLNFLMRGSPYIYQGEEFGAVNPHYLSLDKFRDVESTNYIKILQDQKISDVQILKILNAKSRDNCRVPLAWFGNQAGNKNGGFTTGTPWLSQSESYLKHNANDDMASNKSVYKIYQTLASLRKNNDVIAFGNYEKIEVALELGLFAFARKHEGQTIVVICNFYGKDVSLSKNTHKYLNSTVESTIFSNYECASNCDCYIGDSINLKPYQTLAFKIK